MRKMIMGVAAALAMGTLSGCMAAVREHHPAPPQCPLVTWIDGHHDRWGNWHSGHWRCS